MSREVLTVALLGLVFSGCSLLQAGAGWPGQFAVRRVAVIAVGLSVVAAAAVQLAREGGVSDHPKP